MNGVGVLKAQLIVVNHILHGVVARMRPEEWTARPAPGMNLPGYAIWHVPATQDWVAHVAVRGQPEVRMQGKWASMPGINPNIPPFGCTQEQADAVARAANATEVLAYADEVHAALLAWLDNLSDDDLARVPDLAVNARRYPAERITEDYLVEIADQMEWNLARFLASPCIGHARGHFGELDVQIALLRAHAA